MTYINLSKKRTNGNNTFLFACFALAAALAFTLIFEYNEMVNMTYDIEEAKAAIEALHAHSAERKAFLYDALSPGALDAAGGAMGLVRERNPRYISGLSELLVRSTVR